MTYTWWFQVLCSITNYNKNSKDWYHYIIELFKTRILGKKKQGKQKHQDKRKFKSCWRFAKGTPRNDLKVKHNTTIVSRESTFWRLILFPFRFSLGGYLILLFVIAHYVSPNNIYSFYSKNNSKDLWSLLH